MRKILVIFLLMFPAICQAGTWCLIRDENEYCNFESSEACYSVAAARGGSCRENYKLYGAQGEQPWCVVTAQNRRCQYGYKPDCIRAAMQLNGGCVENVERALRAEKSGKQEEQVAGPARCADGDLSCSLGTQLNRSVL